MVKHWKPIACVGIFNSAIPFLCFSFAAQSIPAGLSSIFNAATPLCGAVIAWLWLGDRLTGLRTLGLLIGFSGVVFLAWQNAGSNPTQVSDPQSAERSWAVAACLIATVCYGFSASYIKHNLAGVPTLASATGSLIAAAGILCGPAWFRWPLIPPTGAAWLSVLLLSVGCTGVAYVVFYRLIANAGPTNAMAVTYLIPIFANLWSWLFLAEAPNLTMLIGCLLILGGVGLSTGLIRGRGGAS